MERSIRKFSPSTIEGRTIAITGVRAAGKTTLVKDLLRRFEFEHIELVRTTGKDRGGRSGVEKNHHQYFDLIPHESIHDEYTDAVVKTSLKNGLRRRVMENVLRTPASYSRTACSTRSGRGIRK
jgi:molybdopterin-guanine dinucleotide biosynthesis protein